MSDFFIKTARYFWEYPLAALLVAAELLVVVLLFRYRKIKSEKRIAEKKAKYAKSIDMLYEDITNPLWVENGGEMLSYDKTRADEDN